MTVSSSNNQNRYEGNGVTDTFAFSGRIFATSDLSVEIITRSDDTLEETLTETTHYTVTINSDESASVVVVAGKIPSVTQDIQLRRVLPQTQSLSLPTGTAFPAKKVEDSLDRNTVQVQDLAADVARAIKLSATSALTDIELPAAVASEVIGWNAAADNLTTYTFAEFGDDIDLAFSGLASGDYLKYNGSEWANIDNDQLKADLGIAKRNSTTTNPTVNDDSSQGYALYSEWINTTTTEKWVCLDATVGAAVWEQGTLDSSDLGSASVADLIDDDSFATATSSNIPSAESVKAYVDRKAYAEVLTTAGFATVIPLDDTIPQSSEGTEQVTVSYTPKSSTSTLIIRAQFNGSNSASDRTGVMAIFKDSDADAIGASAIGMGSGGVNISHIAEFRITSGTTSAITFKMRYGSDSGTCYRNANFSGTRLFGGVMSTWISIEEVDI